MSEPELPNAIEIRTGSRLHFGLFAIGQCHERQFGGVGAMVDLPVAVQLSLKSKGQLQGRVGNSVVKKAMDQWFDWASVNGLGQKHWPSPAEISVSVPQAPQHHTGLGLGTQLALATSVGLSAWLCGDVPEPEQAALAVSRGLRSAVGTYGFFRGGLIAEQGKRHDETLSPLAERIEFPTEWRWLVCEPISEAGLSGDEEAKAFSKLPSASISEVDWLKDKLWQDLVPALKEKDFDGFSEALFEYGRRAGECFAEVQGGPYRNPEIARLVDCLRELGCGGVGQSSWGPSVFALAPNDAAAETLAQQVQLQVGRTRLKQVQIVSPRNRGYEIIHHQESEAARSCQNSV